MGPRILIGLAVAFLTSASAFGQLTQYWVNPAGGDWGVPTNWNPAGAPEYPVFNLGSTSGYTTSISTNYYTFSVSVQTDNVALDLNGNTLTTPALNVATANGQNGSLTLVGPGTVDILNEDTSGSGGQQEPGNLYVGTGGGVGQLTVNGATVENSGSEHTGQFVANGLLVENGGQLNLPNSGSVSISSAVFNDGSLTPWSAAMVSLNDITMTDGSSASGLLVNINGAYLDDSTIHSSEGGTISGVVTLLDNASILMAGQVVAGTINIMATARDPMDAMTMDSRGVLSIQLYNGIDNPITAPGSNDEGTLDFTLENGFIPSIGEQFQVMNIPSFPNSAGTFATINLPTLSGATWDTSQLYNTGIISVVVPEPISLGMAAMAAAALSLRRQRRNSATEVDNPRVGNLTHSFSSTQ
jgi:hypothetical protein